MPSHVREQGSPTGYALRVERCKAGQSYFVRTLSPAYGGIFTHWGRGKSHYCTGEPCESPYHKTGSFWKGYFAGEIWDGSKGLWCPVVWELTETAELDMRGIYARGQIWYFEREEPTDKRKPPCRASLSEVVDGELLRPAPDYVPVLRSLYHAMKLTAAMKNPLPDRVMVAAEQGAPPSALAKDSRPKPETDNRTTKQIEESMRAQGWLPGELLRVSADDKVLNRNGTH